MHEQIGVWIDHREAFIVSAANKDDSETTQHLPSGIEKRAHYSGHSSEDGSAEDRRDHQYQTHLERYYDQVIAQLKDSKSILIFGPGEAKIELRKRFTHKGHGEKIVAVEAADRMTEPQIRAKVRHYFET
jgi:stalled ribosome rescue protein Dom34